MSKHQSKDQQYKQRLKTINPITMEQQYVRSVIEDEVRKAHTSVTFIDPKEYTPERIEALINQAYR